MAFMRSWESGCSMARILAPMTPASDPACGGGASFPRLGKGSIVGTPRRRLRYGAGWRNVPRRTGSGAALSQKVSHSDAVASWGMADSLSPDRISPPCREGPHPEPNCLGPVGQVVKTVPTGPQAAAEYLRDKCSNFGFAETRAPEAVAAGP